MTTSTPHPVRVHDAGDHTEVTIIGVIDEHTDLTPLNALGGRVRFDLHGVRRINSMGCRAWTEAIKDLSSRAQMTFARCSPPIVDQLNMIHGFFSGGRVESFYGSMVCPTCDTDQLHLFDFEAVRDHGSLTEVRCPKCSTPMELDDLEDQYLLFIREPTVAR
jgi:hypothetical protein